MLWILLSKRAWSSPSGNSSHKKIGNAVVRNKVKRQAKAIIRNYVNTHEGDFIIIAKKAILDQSFADFEQAIAVIFNKKRSKEMKNKKEKDFLNLEL